MKIKKNILIGGIVIIVLMFILRSKTGFAYATGKGTVDRVNSYDSTIQSMSYVYGIPAKRIKAHIAVESAGDPNAIGSVGEVGLMQMTAVALTDVNNVYFAHDPYTLEDLKNPVHAINAGVAYLAYLFDRLFDYDKTSMAYNVGIGGLTSNKTKAAEYLTRIKIAESKF